MTRKFRLWSSALVAMLALIGLGTTANLSAQGVTTATVVGEVTDEEGTPLGGAEVVITNTATGVQRQALTRQDGRFLLTGLRPGGPYLLTVDLLGYAEGRIEDFNLGLGETREIDVNLRTEAIDMEAITVTAVRGGDQSGVRTTVEEETIRRAPTLNREIVDVARLTPQAFVANEDDDGAAISIAGQNNEYNSLYIDGVVNNDVFGLSAQGTNGGQTGAPPISFDAIEQLQIAISPYDVTQGGFTGGAINAITRSGTNTLEGSLYYQLRNESLAGDSDWFDDPQPLDDFSTARYGFRLGGPILENKLFFFVNGEIFRSETPAPFDFSVYEGDATQTELQSLRQTLIDEVGYDPGTFGSKKSTLDDNKVLVKLDWNINSRHRLTARHSYSQSDNTDAFASGARTIAYSNTAEVFPNTTNSTALELNSTFGDRFNNKLLIGLTFVRDDRGFAGDPFPYVEIDNGQGTIEIGSEQFSTGNVLNQDILSITNNLQWALGDHTVTIGTHNEFYDIGNLFLRQNFGSYEYGSIDAFLQSVRAVNDAGITPAEPDNFERGFSLVDDVTGDASDAIGAFKAYQLGFYVQDQWRVNDRLQITAGLRLDLPNITTDPRTNAEVQDIVTGQLAAQHDLLGGVPGEAPAMLAYWAPRVGFQYDLNEIGTARLRGGVGVFTGRVPFVYPGAMYLNNGVTAGYVSTGSGTLDGTEPIPFIPNPQNGLTAADFGRDVLPSGEVDIFAEDFRYPRVFRTSLGLDYLLPGNILGTIEGQYTKNLDNILVRNINLQPQNVTLDGPDNRPIYNYGSFFFTVDRFSNDTNLGSNLGMNTSASRIQNTIDPVYLVTNYDAGYTYDVTVALSRQFGDATTASIAYTYGDAYSVNDATSDQIHSVWRFNENVNGLNDLEMARSDFSIGSRLVAQVDHREEFLEHLATSVSAVFTVESGRPFSWIIGNNFTFTGEGSGTSPLAYIPESANDILISDIVDGSGAVVVSAAEQRAALESFISGNDYLSSRRGQYAERNGDRAPTEYVLDVRLAQELFTNIGGRLNTVEFTLDIFNFTNLLNSDWGRRYNAGFRTVDLLRFEGYMDPANDDFRPVYTFRFEDENMDEYWDDRVLDFGTYGSRWRMQVGLRYSF